jgi:hypothetical protein
MPTSTGAVLAPFPVHRKTSARVAMFDLSEASAQLVTSVSVNMESKRFRLRASTWIACNAKSSRPAFCPWMRAPAASSNWRELGLQQPDHHFRAGRHRAGCHALFEVVHQRNVSRTAGAVGGDEAGALDANAGAARIPPLRAYPGDDRGWGRLNDGGRITATSQEISSGGMSLKGNHVPEQGQPGGSVVFLADAAARLGARPGHMEEKPNKSFGIRFDSTDERRQRLKEWIVAYLEG